MPTVQPRDSEWLTRKRLIDPKLRAAGWCAVRYSDTKPLAAYDRCAIEEFPTDNGPADYALCVGGKILGIVEAKKLTLGPQNVLTQAERYSKASSNNPLNFRDYRVPFLYSTNGEIIWHHDIRHPLSRSHTISRFHTPEALAERFTAESYTALTSLDSLSSSGGSTSSVMCRVNCSTVPKCLQQAGHPVSTILCSRLMNVERLCRWISVWSARSSSDFFISAF
jgi:type I site-specific restriction endonuclease